MACTAKVWKPVSVCVLLFNLARMVLILFTSYKTLEVVEEKRAETPLVMSTGPIFPDYYGEESEDSSGSDEEGMDSSGSGEGRVRRDLGEWQPSPTLVDSLYMSVAVSEVIAMLAVTATIMGPLTQKIPTLRWLKSLGLLRIAWKRVLFVVVAIVYSQLNLKYRKGRYENTSEMKYFDPPLRVAMVWMTVVEYAMLGLLESAVILFTPERIEERLSRRVKKLGKAWGGVTLAAYLTGSLASGIRNIFICLYFAIVAVFVMQDEQGKVEARADVAMLTVIVVLQIAIVLIRGKYGNFFLRFFLGYILNEGDDFNKLLHEDDEFSKKVDAEEYTEAMSA